MFSDKKTLEALKKLINTKSKKIKKTAKSSSSSSDDLSTAQATPNKKP